MAPDGEALTIVLGYDGSDAARRGMAHIGQLATQPEKVIVVAVVPEVAGPLLSDEPLAGGDFDAERLLLEAAEQLRGGDGTAIERRAATGDPAAVLVEVAREASADLVIVGRRGTDFVARTLLGSVAQRVVEHARCDVLVVA
jgi:nucleotide-binding universal stress UspA family protein